ncbi:MAG: SBBP repeat-containing protein [Patescibacteria group bacterium]
MKNIATFLLVTAFLMSASPLHALASYSLKSSSILDGTSTFKTDAEQARDIEIDAKGNIYVTGGTASADFPTTVGAYDRTFGTSGKSLGTNGPMDVFLMKFDSKGDLVWSTLLGGPNYDRAYALELGPHGDVYVAGRAGEQFPTTAGVTQKNFINNSDSTLGAYGLQNGFVAKFSSTGTLKWSTYIGEARQTVVRDIDIDKNDVVHLAIGQSSTAVSFITADAAQKKHPGGQNTIYAKLSSDGTKILYATYISGSGQNSGKPTIRVAPTGDVYFASVSDADDFPVTAGAYQTKRAGNADTVVAKFNANGKLLYATYLGGTGVEDLETHSMAVDALGYAYVTGYTTSSNFPTTKGALQRTFQSANNGTGDAYVAKLSPDGRTLVASTYVGGTKRDEGEGTTFLETTGEIVISGNTGSPNFPVTKDALDTSIGGASDAFIVKLNRDLTKVTYGSFVGGGGTDSARASFASENGIIALGGITKSTNFPAKNSLDSAVNSGNAAFYTQLTALASVGTSVPAVTPVSELSSGSSAVVTDGPLNIRSSAGGGVLGTQPTSATGVIVGGPVVANGYTWWKVDFKDGPDGWCAGSFLASASTVVTPTAASTFTQNSRVVVALGPLNVRSSASGSVTGTQATGASGTLVEGPVTANGYTWWKVDYDTGSDGWSAATFLKPL